jgi:hypothetical protein
MTGYVNCLILTMFYDGKADVTDGANVVGMERDKCLAIADQHCALRRKDRE